MAPRLVVAPTPFHPRLCRSGYREARLDSRTAIWQCFQMAKRIWNFLSGAMTLWAIIELAKSAWLGKAAFLAGIAISPNLLQGFYLLLAMLSGALFAALNYEWIYRLWRRKQQIVEEERRAAESERERVAYRLALAVRSVIDGLELPTSDKSLSADMAYMQHLFREQGVELILPNNVNGSLVRLKLILKLLLDGRLGPALQLASRLGITT